MRYLCRLLFGLLLFMVMTAGGMVTAREVIAQDNAGVRMPNFQGSETRFGKPDLLATRVIRFLTDDEFPPLHFPDASGQPTGFSVELARAACTVLKVVCTVQVRRFDTLLDALADGRGDVVAAAIPVTPRLHERFAVTRVYHRTPARFVIRKAEGGRDVTEVTPALLAGKRVAVVRGTAHEAYLAAFFPKAVAAPYGDPMTAQSALKDGEADYLFGDGVSLALWLNGALAAQCCAFAGGPYMDSHYFGEGVGFIVRGNDRALRDALDYALNELWKNGVYADLYLRYFPVSFY